MGERGFVSHGRRRYPPSEEPATRFSLASLFLAGLLIGLAAALYYAWIVDPVVYVDAGPSRLGEDFKAEYIFLVSQSYAADGDLPRARARLAALADVDTEARVAAQLENYLRRGAPAAYTQNLAVLAQDLGAGGAAVAIFVPPTPAATPTATPADPESESLPPTPSPTPTTTRLPTNTPTPTLTPTPTPSLTPTPQPVYRLLNQERVCRRDGPAPWIEVITLDAMLEPLPGVEIVVTWDGGADRFFTGFKPELGEGYGDFMMSPDVSYAVMAADGSPPVSGLRLEMCDSGFAGGWRLTFQNLLVGLTPTPPP